MRDVGRDSDWPELIGIYNYAQCIIVKRFVFPSPRFGIRRAVAP